jgi:fluoroacetyl-CoA thioesterase
VTLGPHLVGESAAMSVMVTEDMAATFDDEQVHAVYGTAALVRHAEQVSRRLLVPHLQPGTEGVGGEISVRHHAAVAVGATVDLEAVVVEASARRLVTDISVRVGGKKVADGFFTQVVVHLARWRESALR